MEPMQREDELKQVRDDIRYMINNNYSDSDIESYIGKRGFTVGQIRGDEAISQPEKPEDRAAWQYYGDRFKKGFSNIFRLPSLAIDLVNAPLKAVGIGSDTPFGGSKQVDPLINKAFTIQDYKPKDDLERYGGAVAEFAGGTVLPGGYVASTAAAPARALAIEGLSAITGGLGSELTGDVAAELGGEEFRSTGQAIGGIGFGMLPVISQGAIERGINYGRSVVNKENQLAYARNTARARIISDIEGDPSALKNLEEANELKKSIHGFSPDLAQSTGTPGLINEASRLQRRTPYDLNMAATRYSDNIDVIDDAYRSRFPSGPRIDKAAQQTVRAVNRSLEKQASDLLDEQHALAMKYRGREGSAVGSDLRAKRDQLMAATRNAKNAKYADVYKTADDMGVKVDIGDLKSYVDDAVKREAGAFQDKPRIFSMVQESFDNKSMLILPKGVNSQNQVSFEKLHSLKRQVNADYKASLRTENTTRTYYLRGLKEQIDKKIEAFKDIGYGKLAEKLSDADEFWRIQYDQRFRKGLGGLMDRSGRYGDVTPDEKVVSGLIFKPNESGGVRDFIKLYGDDPDARSFLKDGILDMFFRESSTKEGIINKGSIESFMRRHKEAFDLLPDTKALFNDMDDLNKALIKRRFVVDNKISLFNKTQLAKLAGIEDLDGQLSLALKSNKAMTSLITSVSKIPGGKQSLARAIADHVRSMPDPYQFILDNENVLSGTLSKLGASHYKNLKEIAKASAIIDRSKPPLTVAASEAELDPLYKKFGTTFRSMLSQFRAASQGRVSQEYVFSDISGKYLFKLQQAEADKLLDAAIHNPDIAKTLSDLSKVDKMSIKQANSLHKHLVSLGLRSLVASDTETNNE